MRGWERMGGREGGERGREEGRERGKGRREEEERDGSEREGGTKRCQHAHC